MNPARPYDSRWQRIRLTVLERDNHLCQLQLDGCTTTADAVDHRIPLSEGGRRLDIDNLRASCTHCNSVRSRRRRAELARHALTTPTTSTPSRVW